MSEELAELRTEVAENPGSDRFVELAELLTTYCSPAQRQGRFVFAAWL